MMLAWTPYTSRRQFGLLDPSTQVQNHELSQIWGKHPLIQAQAGSDLVMVKPVMSCLDFVGKVKRALQMSTFIYQVLGK